jgi:F-type H+-transporting ATPase subunit a
MQYHQLWITGLVNKLIGKHVAALLAFLHITVSDPSNPIPNHIAVELVIIVLAVLFFAFLRTRLSVNRPGMLQQMFEMVLTNPMGVGARDLLDDMIGHHGRAYLSVIGGVGLFVLFCNLISIIPGFESPTANITGTIGAALVVFFYYHYCGIRHHGAGRYLKQFLGPLQPMSLVNLLIVLPLMALMVMIEAISHVARILSLSVRLFANMFVSELLYGVFLGLALFAFSSGWSLSPALGAVIVIFPLTFPIAFIGLHIFVAVLQAFVFTLLPTIYLSGAVAEEH